MIERDRSVAVASSPRRPPRRLTIVVPALNEEDKIGPTLVALIEAADRHLDDYEIIVVDDGSTDRTFDVASRFATKYSKVRVHRQPINRGLGVSYRYGLEQARFEHLTVVPGDNVFQCIAFDNVFPLVGTAPLVISYRGTEMRTRVRKMLSVICTLMMRIATGKAVRDAHGMFVYPVAVARTISVQTGYGYHIESLGRLLCLLPSFVQVSAPINPRPDASSGVMRFKVVKLLGMTMLRLIGWRLAGLMGLTSMAEASADTSKAPRRTAL